MTSAMPRQKHNFSPRQASCEQIVGRGAERGVDLAPFLAGEPLDVIEPTSPDNSNAILCHARRYIHPGSQARGIYGTVGNGDGSAILRRQTRRLAGPFRTRRVGDRRSGPRLLTGYVLGRFPPRPTAPRNRSLNSFSLLVARSRSSQ